MKGHRVLSWVCFSWTLLWACGGLQAQTVAPRTLSEGEEVHAERPTLAFDVQLPLGFDRSGLRLLLDGDDLSEFARWGSSEVWVVPPLPIPDGEHVAEVRRRSPEGGEETLAKVSFKAVPPRRRTVLALELKDAPSLGLASEGSGNLALAPHVSGVWSGAAGAASVDAAWAPSGPLEGPRPDLPDPEAVLQLERGGFQARAGLIRSAGWQGSAPQDVQEEPQLFAVRAARQALDARWDDAAWGRVTLFGDVLDPAVTGVGAVPRQKITSLGWHPPALFGRRLDLQLYSLRSRAEEGDASSILPGGPPSTEAGDLNAFLLTFRPGGPGGVWSLVTEAALSRRRESSTGSPIPDRGNAYRLNAAGTVAGQSLSLRYSSVEAGFSNPGDPGLARGRTEGGLELSRYAPRWDYRVSAGFGQDRGSGTGAESREGRLHAGWRPLEGLEVALEGARQEVQSPFVDLDHTDFRLSLSRRRGLWTVDLAAAGGATAIAQAVQKDRSFEGMIRRDEAGRWGLTAGLSAAEQRVNPVGAVTRLASFLLAPVWKPVGDRLRLSLRLQAIASGFSAEAFDDGTLGAQAAATWSLPERWQSLSLTAQAGWQRSPLGIDHRAELSLSLVPLWRARR